VLRQSWTAQEEIVGRRTELRRQIAKLARQQSLREEAASHIQRRRRSLLRRAGVRRDQELRELALQASQAEALRTEFDTLNREITAAVGGHCVEEIIGQQIQGQPAAEIEKTRQELAERIGLLDRQFQEHFERRGQLAEQLKALADDRRLGQRRLDLSMVEKRLSDALHRWQVLAATSQSLDAVRTVYERDRQPETLQEASGYLARLTGGLYRRVWTPLGEHVLRVDDEQGDSRSVDQLSRGTREQLLLALRLSLAAAYARRGAALPMVLDDVLVNFDTHRAKAAAGVLRDFAAAGHQLLVFTCHEHILRMFQSLDVHAIELAGSVEKREETPRPEPTRRRRARKASKPEETPDRTAASAPTPVEPEPPALAPPEEVVVVAEAVPSMESADDADDEEDDALDDAPWEETAGDEEDVLDDDAEAA